VALGCQTSVGRRGACGVQALRRQAMRLVVVPQTLLCVEIADAERRSTAWRQWRQKAEETGEMAK